MKNTMNIEMFVDTSFIESMKNCNLQLNKPIKKEKVITFDQKHESPTSGYVTLFKFKNKYHMYYRGYSHIENKEIAYEYTCLALSDDGINFYRPSLNLVEFDGNKNNNIILKDREICHNFTPFIDTNPKALSSQIIKAVGGHKTIAINKAKLYGLFSEDGIHFKKIQEEPIITDGMFDSQNVVFFDNSINKYRCYSRYFDNEHLKNPKAYEGIRSIQSCTSADFINWSSNIKNSYIPDIKEEFYTNATIRVDEANLYLSFPKRYVSTRERNFYNSEGTGVSDCVFLSSKDGYTFDRTFMQAYVRPGLDRKNWINRNNMMAKGLLDTGEKEFSLYISENYRTNTAGLRRLSIRKYGFASVNAKYFEGELITKTFLLNSKIEINYSTSAIGYVNATLLDEDNNILASSKEVYGDEIFEELKFDNDIKKYNNKPVKLLFKLKDCDLYAIKI